MKDYAKIYFAQEEKEVRALENNIKKMQDEGNYPKNFDMPIALQYELTANCNLKCLHCYNRSGDSDKETKMKVDDWKKLSKNIVEAGGIFQCILSGGEPFLLGEKLFEIMDILHDDGTSFILITNGFYLTPEKIKKLEKYRFFWLQISIDGATREYHDKFRGVTGSWDNAIQAAFNVSKAGIPLVIAHTVSGENIEEIEKMCDIAYGLGASSIIIGEINPSGRAVEYSNLLLTEEERNRMYEKIETCRGKYFGKMSIQHSMFTKNQLKRYQILPNSGLIVRPNGDMRMDCMAPFTLGNVLEDDFLEKWRNKGKNAWQENIVNEYIEKMDCFTGNSTILQNHIDEDIKI